VRISWPTLVLTELSLHTQLPLQLLSFLHNRNSFEEVTKPRVTFSLHKVFSRWKVWIVRFPRLIIHQFHLMSAKPIVLHRILKELFLLLLLLLASGFTNFCHWS